MKRRTWLLLIGGLALAVLLYLVVDTFFVFHPGVTERNGRLLREGMTLEVVERVLGPPTERSPTLVSDKPGIVNVVVSWNAADGVAAVNFAGPEAGELGIEADFWGEEGQEEPEGDGMILKMRRG